MHLFHTIAPNSPFWCRLDWHKASEHTHKAHILIERGGDQINSALRCAQRQRPLDRGAKCCIVGAMLGKHVRLLAQQQLAVSEKN